MNCLKTEEEDFDCPYVDTATMIKEQRCDECPFNEDYLDILRSTGELYGRSISDNNP
jgi:hypothetical protein